jgi:oligoribonuclease
VAELIRNAIKLDDEECAAALLDIVAREDYAPLVRTWTAKDKHKHKLIHLLVNFKKPQSVQAIHPYVDMNEPRSSDQCTPLHLSAWTKNDTLIELLIDLGCDKTLKNKYGEDCDALVKNAAKRSNIVFLDLELTNLPSVLPAPDILEIAVVVTDKNLNELERGHWIVSPPEGCVLSEFVQNNFQDTAAGGNNLLSDVKAHGRPLEEASAELMALLERTCLATQCRLGGNSVHCDREVMKHKMPAVYAFCSHQIVDVSTMLSMCSTWAPAGMKGLWQSTSVSTVTSVDGNSETKKMRVEGAGAVAPPSLDPNTGEHRAMADVERSIASLRYIKENVFKCLM